jgi:glucose 1-dehydrogenase
MRLDGQTAVVTGGCGDIGREIVLALCAAGARTAVNDILPEEAAEPLLRRVRDAGGQAEYYQADLCRRAEVDAMFAGIRESYGAPDICVGNAAIVEVAPFLDVTPENWQRHLDVNLTGCFHTGQAAARAMVEARKPGRIIFVSSWVQDVPSENISPYCVSKSGLKMLARSMALELGRHGITVNLLAPGFVDAGLSGRILRDKPELREQIEKLVPLGYLQPASEVADAVMLLCSPAARYVTGSTLLADGGNSLFRRGGNA